MDQQCNLSDIALRLAFTQSPSSGPRLCAAAPSARARGLQLGLNINSVYITMSVVESTHRREVGLGRRTFTANTSAAVLAGRRLQPVA